MMKIDVSIIAFVINCSFKISIFFKVTGGLMYAVIYRHGFTPSMRGCTSARKWIPLNRIG